MKTFIIGANVGTTGVTGGAFVKQDGSGKVINNDTPGSEIGIAETTQVPGTINYTGKVGVIKQGLVKVTAVAGTYNFGDALEVATGGQKVKALATGKQIATAAESKVLSADGSLTVYLNIA